MNVDPTQFAVVVERLGEMREDAKATRESVRGIELTLAEFKGVPGQLEALKLTVAQQGEDLTQHKTLVRILAAVLSISVGLIGWGWKEYSAAKHFDMQTDRRLYLIEFKLGLPPPSTDGKPE